MEKNLCADALLQCIRKNGITGQMIIDGVLNEDTEADLGITNRAQRRSLMQNLRKMMEENGSATLT